MKYWVRRVVKPLVDDLGYHRICEIGASQGGATDIISRAVGVSLAVIDPCLDADLHEKYKQQPNVQIHQGLSLEILPTLREPFDCFLIDGDHNWYTVFNELQTIHQKNLLRGGGVMFLHDVGWPYGRRDMYYQPDKIPPQFVRPYAQAGIVKDQSELSRTEGTNSEYCNAQTEGGSRNGVLTAVEDFVAMHTRQYLLLCFRDERGLGVLLNLKGLSKRIVWKWRVRCWAFNLTAAAKGTLRRNIPWLHRLLKGMVTRGAGA